MDSECVEAVLDAAKLCEGLGHDVVEASPAIDSEMMRQSFLAVFGAGIAWQIDWFARFSDRVPSPDQFEPGTWATYELARATSASEYLLAVQWLQIVSRDVGRFFVDHDVWLTPTLAEPPVLLGEFDAPADFPLAQLVRAAAYVPFTPIANATGQPAMSVPLYWTDDGLPVGAHFVGRFGDEATLVRLAAQLESARPWEKRRPRA